MSTVLDRLRDEFVTPGDGQITLAVARHEAETWPSPLVGEYARQRAHLVHGLADDVGAPVVVSWGETDGPRPHEVVEVVPALSQAIVPAVATGESTTARELVRPGDHCPAGISHRRQCLVQIG